MYRGKDWKELIRVISAPLLALISFALYFSTLAPGVTGFDSAELSSGVYTLGIVHPTGYPLYLLLGKLFSLLVAVRDLAFRLNLMSACFAALTVFFIFKVIFKLTGNLLAAWIASVFLVISSHFWQMAIVAEVYTLHTFFLALNLFLLLKWRETGRFAYLFAFSFAFGLSLANHVSGGLFLPAYLWLALYGKKDLIKNWKRCLYCGGFFLVGLLPYLYLPIRSLASPELDYVRTYYNVDLTTLKGLFWMISGKAYGYFAFGYSLSEIPGEVARLARFLWRDFFGVGVLLAFFGLVADWQKTWKLKVGLLLIFLANALFFINYRVIDKDTMFLPCYLITALFIGEGVAALFAWLGVLQHKRVFPAWVKTATASILALAVLLGGLLNYSWLDMSQETDQEIVIREVLSSAAPNSTIISQWSSAVILEYYQTVEGLRPDLKIINRSRINAAQYYKYWAQHFDHKSIMEKISQQELDFVNNEIKQRNVYIIEYDPLYLRRFEYIPQENYFRLSVVNQK